MEGLVDRMRVAGFELEFSSAFPVRRPSIYDVHTEGEGVKLRWTYVNGGGVKPHVDVYTEN